MFENLKNYELNEKVKSLAAEERRLTKEILEYIAEVDRRKLYLDMAYPSLFAYLTEEIGYSVGSAQRRIDAARLLERVPDVSAKIETGALNLVQISKLQQVCRAVKKEGRFVSVVEQKEILEKLAGQGAEQTDLILAREFDVPVRNEEKQRVQQDESVRLELTFSKADMAIINRAREILSHKTGGNLKDTILEMAQKIVKMAEPKVREKTAEPKNQAFNQIATPDRTSTVEVQSRILPKMPPKTVAPRLKKEILARDKCCQYRDKNTGKICGARRFLEVDHIQPRFAQGDNSAQNLRVLCRNHNQRRYWVER